MNGRPRIPSAIKRLQGTDQPCRMNPLEPRPEPAVPPCPPDADDDYRQAWEAHARLLSAMGVLTRADWTQFQQLVEAWLLRQQTWREFQRRDDCVNVGASGCERAAPQLKNHPATDKHYSQLAARFGLNPADRTRVSVVESVEDNPWDRL